MVHSNDMADMVPSLTKLSNPIKERYNRHVTGYNLINSMKGKISVSVGEASNLELPIRDAGKCDVLPYT